MHVDVPADVPTRRPQAKHPNQASHASVPTSRIKPRGPGARFEIFVTVVFHIASAVVARSEKEWQPFGDKQEGARLLTFWVRGFFALVGRFHRPPFEKQ